MINFLSTNQRLKLIFTILFTCFITIRTLIDISIYQSNIKLRLLNKWII